MTDTITILDSDDETPPPSPPPTTTNLNERTNNNNLNTTLGTASSRHISLSGDESDSSSHHISTPTPLPDHHEEGANATSILQQGSRLPSANSRTRPNMSDREASHSEQRQDEREVAAAGRSSTRIPDITRKNSNETPSIPNRRASTSHSSFTGTTPSNEQQAPPTSTLANKQRERAGIACLDLSDDDDDDELDDSRGQGGGEMIELADSSDNEIDNEVTPSASTSDSPAHSDPDSNEEAEPEANLNPKRARSERSKGKGKGKGKEMIILGDSSSPDETSTPSSTRRTPRTRRDRHNTQPSTSFSKNLSRPAADVIEISSDGSERDERILLPLSEIFQKGKGKEKQKEEKGRRKSQSTSIKGSKSPKVRRGMGSPIPGSATPRKTSKSPLLESETPRATTLHDDNGRAGSSNPGAQMDFDATPRAKLIAHRNPLSKLPTSATLTTKVAVTSFDTSHHSRTPPASISSASPPLLPNLVAPSHPVSPKSTDLPLPPRKQKIATPEGTPPALRRRMEVEAKSGAGGMELEVEAKLGDHEVDRLGGEEGLNVDGQDQRREEGEEMERLELGVLSDHEREVEALLIPTASESGRDEREMESRSNAMDISRSTSPSSPIVDFEQEGVREDDCEAVLKTYSRDSRVEGGAEEMEGLHDGSGLMDDELEVRRRGDAMDISRSTSPSPLADVEEDVILDEADLEPLLISKSSPVPVLTINPSSASPLRLSSEASSTGGTNLVESIISLPPTFKNRSPPTRKEVSRIQFLAQSLAGGLEVIEAFPSISTTPSVHQESLLLRVDGFGQESLSPALSSRASTSKSTTPLSAGVSQNSTPGIDMAIMKHLSISSPPAGVSSVLSPALSSLSIKAADMSIPRDESLDIGNAPAQESDTANSAPRGLSPQSAATFPEPTEPHAPPVPVVPVRIYRGGRKSTTRKAPRREIPSSPSSSGTDESDTDSDSSSGDSVQIIDDYLNAGQQTTGPLPSGEEEDMVMQSLETVAPSRSPELYAKDQPEDLSDLRALNSPASSSSTTSRSSNGSGTSATRAAKRTAPIVEDLPVKRPKASSRKIDGDQLRNHRGMKIETKGTCKLVDGTRLVDPLLQRKEDGEPLQTTERRLERERKENEARLKDYKNRQRLTSCSRRNIAGPSFADEYIDEFDDDLQCALSEDPKRKSQPQDTEAFNAMIEESQLLELGHTHGPRIRVVPPESGEGPYSPLFEFVYTNRVVYSQGAEIVPEQSPGCDCIGRCQDPINKNKCACLKRQIRACSRVDKGESYSGTKEFAYDERGILREDIRLQEEAIWECNSECGCDDRCQNRNVGKKLGVSVDIYWTGECGWGVRNPFDFDTIPAGTVLGIYSGELLTYPEARDRDDTYLWYGRNYLFDVDNWTIARKTERIKRRERDRLAGRKSRKRRKKYEKRKKLLADAEDIDENDDFQCLYNMDAFHVGNWTRFANHVCEGANTRVHCVYVDEAHYTRPLEVFIAAKDIPSGDQITISYSGEGSLPPGTSLADYKKEAARQRLISDHPCKCGADLCFGYTFKTDEPEDDVSA